MKKIALILPIFMLLISSAFALTMSESGNTTIITGTVYRGSIYPGHEIPFAHIDVSCGSASASLNANSEGDFAVGFDKSDCKQGDTLSVHAVSPDGLVSGDLTTSCSKGTNCKDVVCGVMNASPVLNLENEIPEFTPIYALVALVGSGVMFILLRRN